MGNKVVKWKPGKDSVVDSRVISKSDWKSINIDQDELVFDRANGFRVDASDLGEVVMDYLNEDPDFSVLEDKSAPSEEETEVVRKAASGSDGDVAEQGSASPNTTSGTAGRAPTAGRGRTA